MPFFQSDGARIFYQRQGAGDPLLVFVHGYCCSHQDWEYQVQAFSPRHCVVACDLRGHGQSDRDPERSSIETFGADVSALVQVLNARPAVLVGHSMGCRVVLQACLRAPERIAGLVLIDGSWVSPSDLPIMARAVLQRLETMGYTAFLKQEFEGMFLPGADPVLKQRIVAQALATPEAVGRPVFLRAMEWDAHSMEAALSQIAVPMLVLQSTAVGRERTRVPLEQVGTTPWLELVWRRVATARVRALPGVGHFSMLEAPDAVNQEIKSFIASLDVPLR
jgi:pimeloyl-ACP methyl ester carboxylesterase